MGALFVDKLSWDPSRGIWPRSGGAVALLALLSNQHRLWPSGSFDRSDRLIHLPGSPALGNVDHPHGDNAAKVGHPWVLELLVLGHNATTGHLLNDPDKNVQEHVQADTANQAVGDGVGEGHQGNANKGWNGIAHVLPVDIRHSADHHRADQDKDAAGGPRGNRSEDGGEEDGDEEAHASRHGCEARLATLTDTGTGLDEGSDGGSTQNSTNGDTNGVDHVTTDTYHVSNRRIGKTQRRQLEHTQWWNPQSHQSPHQQGWHSEPWRTWYRWYRECRRRGR